MNTVIREIWSNLATLTVISVENCAQNWRTGLPDWAGLLLTK